MSFVSIDDLVSSITSGAVGKLPFNKVVTAGATSVAGRWHEAFTGAGSGGIGVLTGAAGVGAVRQRTSLGALPLNADVTPDTRHLLSMQLVTPATTMVPAMALLTDILWVYPSCALTGAPTAISSHPTWTGTGNTRFTNANGVHLSLIVTTATTAGNGQVTATYVNQAGTAGRVSASAYSPAVATPIGCLYGNSNAAVTLGGPFFGLQATDLGVQSLTSYAINVGATTGVGAFVLHRPIAMIPLVAANVAGERDYLSGIPTLPRIHDDACLAFMLQIGGAMTASQTLTGEINYGWG